MVPHDQNSRIPEGAAQVSRVVNKQGQWNNVDQNVLYLYSVECKYSFCAWPAMEGAKVGRYGLFAMALAPGECSKFFC